MEEFLKAYNYKLHRNSNKAIKYEIEIDGKPVIRDIQSMFLIKEIKMDREMSDIYITEEYEMFSFLRSNREVTLNKKLENSILQKGIIRPIIVNSTMQIIDGQHRYSIARKYGLPVPYYVSVNKEMNDIIKINNTACKWRVIDYINKYVILGNEEYKKLKDLHIENNKIPLVELVSVCMGSWTRQNKMMTEVKNGMFSFTIMKS